MVLERSFELVSLYILYTDWYTAKARAKASFTDLLHLFCPKTSVILVRMLCSSGCLSGSCVTEFDSMPSGAHELLS